MKVVIYGRGCDMYYKLLMNLEIAIEKLKLLADIKEITSLNEIANNNISFMPTLVINNTKVIEGRSADVSELLKIIERYK